jgi:hypothetical protein
VNALILWLLGAATVITVAILVASALAQLRDELVNLGFINENSRLGRMSLRARRAHLRQILEALGFDQRHLEAMRSASDSVPERARQLGPELQTRPDIYLLRRMKEWTYSLDPPYNFKGSGYYVDMMGLGSRSEEHEHSLAQVFLAWLWLLRRQDVLPAFDCVLAPKDGNPLLAYEVADVCQKQLILCKGAQDKARVQRPSSGLAHETDFEGLRLFVDKQHLEPGRPDRRFRAIAIDDSCANGSQITSAVVRFNQFVSIEANRARFPFEPITDAVVLFRVKIPGQHNRLFTENRVTLHSLLAVGEEQMRRIKESPEEDLVRNPAVYKDDPWACARSILLG